jgi:hypothetical protein
MNLINKSMKSKIVRDEFSMAFLSCAVSRHFSSLAECMEHLQLRYRPSAAVPAPLPGTDRPFPPHLFRGEPGIYDSTHSVRARIELAFPGEMARTQKRLSNLIAYCQERLAGTIHGFSLQERTAFLQHYGLPGYGLDTSADLPTAAYFASAGDTDRIKLIAVIDTTKLLQHRPMPLDLSSGRFGSRPANQKAVTIFLNPRDNFKHPFLASLLGIQWYSFVLTATDRIQYHPSWNFLTRGDGFYAALVPMFVKEYERAYGRIHSKLRPWFPDSTRTALIS